MKKVQRGYGSFVFGLLLFSTVNLQPIWAEDYETTESFSLQEVSTDRTSQIAIDKEEQHQAQTSAALPVQEVALPRTDGAQRISADHLIWTPSSSENLLGGADDFNAILFEAFVDFHETGGPVAAKTFENVNIVTFEEGLAGGVNQFSDYKLPRFNVAILAEEAIKGKKTKTHNGDAVLSSEQMMGIIERVSQTGSEYVRASQLAAFMAAAKADLSTLNQKLWQLPMTGSTGEDLHGRMELKTQAGLNVFEIDPSQGNAVNIVDESKDNTIVIKVKGNNLKFNSIALNGTAINFENTNQIANRILWVFEPKSSTVTFNQTNLTGSVLAPYANVIFQGGYSAINGTLIANRLDGQGSNSELHYIGRYIGKLTQKPEIPVEPEESTDSSTTSDSDSSPASSTTTESETTPESSTTTESETTPDSSTTTESETTPDSSTTTESETTPESSTTTESETTPDSSTTTESETTPDSSTTTDSDSTSNSSTTPDTDWEDPFDQREPDDSEEPLQSEDSSRRPGKPLDDNEPLHSGELKNPTTPSSNQPSQKLPQTGGSGQKASKKIDSVKRLPQTGESRQADMALALVGVGILITTGYFWLRKK
ncbi:collagen-binding domain-containing protein [Enterococcus sp. LJL98]